MCCVVYKSYKVVSVCSVVACEDNSKVDGCSDGCIADSGGYKVVVAVWVRDGVEWSGKGKERSRELYPVRNAQFVIPF